MKMQPFIARASINVMPDAPSCACMHLSLANNPTNPLAVSSHHQLHHANFINRKHTSTIRASLPHHPNPIQHVAAELHLPALQNFYLPPLETVFPAKKHPHHQIITERVNGWIFSWMRPQSQLQQKVIVETDIAGLALYMFPNAPDPKTMELVCKLYAWFRYFDDVADESYTAEHGASDESLSNHLQFVRNVFSNPDSIAEEEIGERPERKAILCLSKELRGSMSPRIYEANFQGILEFLRAAEREAGERKRHGAPDVASYIVNRRQSSLFYNLVFIIQYLMGIELSSDILEMEAMKELHDAGADQFSWVNDVLSFRREYFNQDFENLPSIVYLEQQRLGKGGDFQSAMNKVCEMIRQRERDFIFYLHQMLLSDAVASTPELLIYLQNLPYTLSGHVEWLYTTGRFSIGRHIKPGNHQNPTSIRHGIVNMDRQYDSRME